MWFWRKKKKPVEDTLRSIAQLAGDQIIAPGAGTWFLVLGGLAVGTAATYVAVKRHKKKKAAKSPLSNP